VIATRSKREVTEWTFTFDETEAERLANALTVSLITNGIESEFVTELLSLLPKIEVKQGL
jgi:hypothetical protein